MDIEFELVFNIIAPPENNYQITKVKGEYVKFKGFEQFTFFIYRRRHEFKNICWEEDEFIVTEYSTGASISSGKNIKESLLNAENILNHAGADALKNKIDKMMLYMIKPANK